MLKIGLILAELEQLRGLTDKKRLKCSKLNKSSNYRVKCIRCDNVYIKQPNKAIKKRIEKHVTSIN